MPATQSLKKQLRGIRSTQKLTKAMRTVSTVKFSKLNGIYGGYAPFGDQCRRMFEQYGPGYLRSVPAADPSAPSAVIVMAASKGLCGNFNAEIIRFARETLPTLGKVELVLCGKKAIDALKGGEYPVAKETVLDDVPTFAESSALFDWVMLRRKAGEISGIYVIYPRYVNMMTQTPVLRELLSAAPAEDSGGILFVPDRSTVIQSTIKTVFRGMFYKLVLEAALGAQAATLLTMRSAYDTATEYCAVLEGRINRLRQSTVTADVIETAGSEINLGG